ncbi:MAG: hypothetical protein Q9218_003404 [Villophora microphyllina]
MLIAPAFSRSPLQEACTQGMLDIARLLLARGAFLEHADLSGRTAFTMLWFKGSCSFSRVDVLMVLLAYSPLPSVFARCENISPLGSAAINGNADDLKLLITSGASLADYEIAGDRLIRYSIFGCNPATYDFLEPLMPQGWVSEVDQLGVGALEIALSYPSGHVEDIVRRLVKTGADVHSRAADGKSLCDIARECDKSAESRGLSEPGSSSNTRAYFNALLSSGFDVELNAEGEIWWPTEEGAHGIAFSDPYTPNRD